MYLGPEKNHLIETILSSTHYIYLSWEIWKLIFNYGIWKPACINII